MDKNRRQNNNNLKHFKTHFFVTNTQPQTVTIYVIKDFKYKSETIQRQNFIETITIKGKALKIYLKH